MLIPRPPIVPTDGQAHGAWPILTAAFSPRAKRPTRQHVTHTTRAVTDTSSHSTRATETDGGGRQEQEQVFQSRVFMQNERNRDGGDSGSRGDGRM